MKENGLSTLCPTPITNLWAGHLFSPGGCGRFSGSVPKPPANLLPSLAQPFLFSFSTLYLSLPLLFPIVIVQTTMAGAAAELRRRRGQRRRTSQRPFRAWHIQCVVRAACVGSLPLRGVSFDSERGCVAGRLNVERIPRKPLLRAHLDSRFHLLD